MAISPPTGFLTSSIFAEIGNQRTRFDNLQRQLASGLRSDTYGGLGQDGVRVIDFEQSLGELKSYSRTIETVQFRLNLLETTLGRVDQIASDVKGDINASEFTLHSDGHTTEQSAAQTYLREIFGLLNDQVSGYYPFGGTQSQQRPVLEFNEIFDGTATKAGFRQIAQERNAADLGANGLGRLSVSSPTTTSVNLTQDADNLPFGFKITSIIASDATNVVVTGPAGSPQSVGVEFTGPPDESSYIRISLDLPDGSSTSIELQATQSPEGKLNAFEIGDTPDETATHFNAAITQALEQKANEALRAASTLQASREFFETSRGQTQHRVDGPPFETAIALRDATALDTVEWYRGDNRDTDPREDAIARIDSSLEISYGVRANEEGLTHVIHALAAFSVTTFQQDTPRESVRYSELAIRVERALDFSNGKSSPENIRRYLGASAHISESAKQRNETKQGVIDLLHTDLIRADQEEVAAKLVTLSTRLEASYAATSLLSQATLTNRI